MATKVSVLTLLAKLTLAALAKVVIICFDKSTCIHLND